MQTLTPVIECCTLATPPNFFLMRLKDFAKTENITLEQAAEIILPFTRLFNCVLLTTVVGCILQRPELITPALDSYIYRSPLHRLFQAYPELNLQTSLPAQLIKPQHRLTPMKVRMIDANKFEHLLLAHVGIEPFNQDDKQICIVLKLHKERAYLLEEYFSKHPLPQSFRNANVQLTSLSLDNLKNYIGLVCAADQFDAYLTADLNMLIESLAKHGDAARVVMDLLASHSLMSAKISMRHMSNSLVGDFCRLHQWQVGSALMSLNELNTTANRLVSTNHYLSQASIWLIAAAVLPVKIQQFNVEPAQLTTSLEQALEHSSLQLRYDSPEDFSAALQTQATAQQSFTLTSESVKDLIKSIEKDMFQFQKLITRTFEQSFREQVKKHRPLISLAPLVWLATEFIQFLLQYKLNAFIVLKADCNEMQLESVFSLCMTCNLYSQTLPLSKIPTAYIEGSWEVAWVMKILKYQNKQCERDNLMDVGDCNVWPWQGRSYILPICAMEKYVLLRGKQHIDICLPTCENLAANEWPIAKFHEAFYRSEVTPANVYGAVSSSLITLIFCGYIIAFFASMIMQASKKTFFAFQPLLEKIEDKLSLYVSLVKETQNGPHTNNLTNAVSQLQTACLLPTNRESCRLAYGALLSCEIELKNHPVTLEIKQDIAVVSLAEMQHAKLSAITQTLWHHNTSNVRNDEAVQPEAIYHV